MSSKHRLTALSKLMSYILRHCPDEFGLVLDEEGFISLKELQQAINEEDGWGFVRRSHILEVVYQGDRERFEIKGDRIRATYGHSLPVRICYEPTPPPKILFHATRRRAYPSILERGLLPMGRQYVHLSTSEELALRIGKRKDNRPILLQIHAQRAWQEGIRFFRASPLIYLADEVPPQFIHGPPLPKEEQQKRERVKRPPIAQPEPSLLKGWKREARRFRKTYRSL